MTVVLSTYSCRQELETVAHEHYNTENSQFKTRQIFGDEALQLFNAISPKLAALQKVKFLSKSGTSASYNIGTVDYSKAVEVIDSLGITNYTFRVNHTDDSETVFHNLVANKVGTEYKFTLLKYDIDQPSGVAKELQGGFSGEVTSFYLDDASECPPVTVDISEGTPGGGSEPGSPVDPPGSSGSGTGGSCIELTYAIECLNCHRQFNSWNSFQSAECGSGAYPYQIVIRSNVKSLCKTSITGCLPEGGVGVIEPDERTPCEVLKENSENPIFQAKLDSLKQLVSLDNPNRDHKETGITVTKNGSNLTFNTFTEPVETGIANAVAVEMELSNFDIAAMHNHYEGTFSAPQFGDIVTFYTGYKIVVPYRKNAYTFYTVDMYGTEYAFRMNDTTSLDALFAGLHQDTTTSTKDEDDKAYKKVFDIFEAYGFKAEKVYTQIEAQKLVMKVLNDPKIGGGVHLYRKGKNESSWGKLNIDANGNVTKEDCPL